MAAVARVTTAPDSFFMLLTCLCQGMDLWERQLFTQ
jgi:hypothetical protein